ncbi:MAG: IclR family transcriptional regulator [Acidimicrobiales bacterium]|jgi:DNA-binding IclR family transcriptional regulator|nr:IclR family transcriptional regulator [Acidimicrobiales bacterium]
MKSVQSIDRAFQILAEVADDPAGISELSRRLNLPTSTVARLLVTLERLGAIERLVDESGYRIGPSMVTMAASVDPTQSLLAVAHSTMQDLVDLLAEAVGLSIPAGYDVHYIGQMDCANPVRVEDWTGVSLPMHVVPSGLVVLAYWSEEALDRYLSRKLDRYTAKSVVTPKRIRARLTEIRDAGIIWMEEEFAEGITSVAAPLFNSAGAVVGALHSHGPSYRFPDDDLRDIVSDRVRSSAKEISLALGYLGEARLPNIN